MGQRPQFDMSKFTTADKILAGAGLLYLIDTFLPWQRVCFRVLTISACPSANAWGGSGSFFGVLTGLFVIAMLVWMGLTMAGVNVQVGIPAKTVSAILVAGTILFGLIKFLVVIGKEGSYGAWVGLILLLALAYGAYMKMQERTADGASPPLPPPGAGYPS